MITDALRALLDPYAGWVRQRGLVPVAVFIPRNGYDTKSASHFIEIAQPLLHRDLLLADVGEAVDVDWGRFNLVEPGGGDICHPSPYGYRVIAEHEASVLERAGLAAAARESAATR